MSQCLHLPPHRDICFDKENQHAHTLSLSQLLSHPSSQLRNCSLHTSKLAHHRTSTGVDHDSVPCFHCPSEASVRLVSEFIRVTWPQGQHRGMSGATHSPHFRRGAVVIRSVQQNGFSQGKCSEATQSHTQLQTQHPAEPGSTHK
jgi:hypothetical protein